MVGLAGERQRQEAEQVDDEDEEHQGRHVREPEPDRLARQPHLGDLRLRDVVDHLADGLPPARARPDLPAHRGGCPMRQVSAAPRSR